MQRTRQGRPAEGEIAGAEVDLAVAGTEIAGIVAGTAGFETSAVVE